VGALRASLPTGECVGGVAGLLDVAELLRTFRDHRRCHRSLECRDVCEIIPGLLLGTALVARDEQWLRHSGLGLVGSCVPRTPRASTPRACSAPACTTSCTPAPA
jgi:hypothetical protein